MRVRAAFAVLGVLIAAIGPSVVACGSDDSNGGNAKNDGGTNNLFQEGGNTVDSNVDITNDPLPKWCGPADGGVSQPPQVTGSEKCPSDKNIEGCPCTTVGEKAKCWPGLRKNRNLGACKDGETTCMTQGELGKVWGKCQGATLPSGSTGAGACNCFSGGQWKITNVVPCLVNIGNTDYYATSAACPPNPSDPAPPKGVPAQPWSTNTVKIDCEGHFKLCFTIKGGDAANPKPTDCTLGKVCTEGDYLQKNVEQAFPDLPGWFSDDDQCAKDALAGGPLYFEMSVNGNSFACDEVGSASNPLVFNRKPYCKIGDTSCQNQASAPFP